MSTSFRSASFKRILVPLDGTPASEAVLPYVSGMASRLGASIVLLTVVEGNVSTDEQPGQHLDRSAAPLREHGLTVATAVQRAEPAFGIVAASLQYEAGLIAMSVHARPRGAPDVIGTVVRNVLHSRVEPVLILREADGEAAGAAWTPPPAIVVGLDGSALAGSALGPAELMAKAFGCQIVLVRAVQPPDALAGAARYYGTGPDNAERYLAGFAETLRQRGFKVATRTGHGTPEQELLAAADSWPGSIIVLSTRGMSGRPNLVLGSVTERIIRSQRHPVLAIPAARQPA
jgi:nucleotide-binding universal stress UspA family protein